MSVEVRLCHPGVCQAIWLQPNICCSHSECTGSGHKLFLMCSVSICRWCWLNEEGGGLFVHLSELAGYQFS